MKCKIGDQVRIKPQYGRNEDPNGYAFNSDMRTFLGSVVTIVNSEMVCTPTYEYTRYQIKEDKQRWWYTEDMFDEKGKMTTEVLENKIAALELELERLKKMLPQVQKVGTDRKVVDLS